MLRLRIALILIAVFPECAFAQHGGGADSGQNYHPKPPNPILNIDYQSAKTCSHFLLSDMLKMKRVTVEIPDPRTNRKNVYEGVTLNELVRNRSNYRIEVFREFWAFKDKQAVSSADLDLQSDLLIADTVNDKRLGPDHPFCLIATDNRGDRVVVRRLAFIRLADTR